MSESWIALVENFLCFVHGNGHMDIIGVDPR